MTVGQNTASQRILLVSVLVIGSLLFALPFVNMVCTSVKMEEEMGADQFALFPRRPVPQCKSPYVRSESVSEPQRPADMDRAIWDALQGPLHDKVRQAVDAWWGRQPNLTSDFSTVNRADAVDCLTNAVASVVLTRLSDKARKRGVPAMLEEVVQFTQPEKIQEAFDDYMPRFALGDVSVRLAQSDLSKRLAGSGDQWSDPSANAALIRLAPPIIKVGQRAMLLRYDSPDHAPMSATFSPRFDLPPTAPPLPPRLSATEATQIERVYIAYKSDQSWCRIDLLITLNGRLLQLDEPVYAAGKQWTELEVRIPGHENTPVSGRTFFLLKDIGPAPASSPPFAVTFRLHPISAAGAWWAKISRNYEIAFRQVPIARYFTTSISLAILTIILSVFGSSLSAYAFARLDFPGRNLLFGVLLATMMVPSQVTMIPVFLIHKSLGWYNTLYPLWVGAAFGAAFFIFMMRQFFLSIPKELEDAARIDGCGFFGIYWHIMLPLIRPTLVTVAIFAFMNSWNNFMGPLIYLNDERLYNLAFGLYKFSLVSGTNNSLIMAGAFVMTLPIIAVFFLFQRYFIRGIAISGLGGR